jgi:hypothetical protein
VVRAVIMGFMDQKTAGLALYGLQTAAMNLPNCDFEPEAADVVLDEEGSTLDDLECDDPHCPDYGQEPRPKLVYREGTKPRGMGFAQKVIARMEEMMSEMKVEKQASAEVSLPVLNPRTD